jgi:urease accessory protein
MMTARVSMNGLPIACTAIIFGLTGTTAHSHAVIEGVSGFQGGMLHPLLAPAHAISLLAIGLLIAQQGARQRTLLLLAYGCGLLIGIILVASAFAANAADTILLGAGGLAGLLVAIAVPLPLVVAGLVVLVAALALELASVPDSISTEDTLLALLGTLLGAWLAVVIVAGGTIQLKREWQRIGLRIAGACTAATAILLLTLRLAR